MQDRKSFEKWALPLLKKIQKVTLLDHYEPLTLEYKKDIGDPLATCDFHYPYQSITISYGDQLLSRFKEKKHKEVFGILVHEMCHPITDPLYAKAVTLWKSKQEVEDERERLTDHIANIIIKANLIQ